MLDLTDDEVRLIRMLIRSYGSAAKTNAEDKFPPHLSEAEQQHWASTYRVCVGLLAKLRTSEERLSAELAQGALVG